MAIPCYQKYWIFFVKSFNTHMTLLVAASTFGLCWRLESQSVLWHCWLGGRKGIRSVKNWVVRCWRGYLSGARCRLAYGPADATATQSLASVKSRLVLPFWYWLTRVVTDRGPLNGCVCVCACVCATVTVTSPNVGALVSLDMRPGCDS